ncbi:MAG TPA: hypothetical protein VNS55_12570 [Nocardioides sp.]|nr:hypothetical protein [Nocardioides sp.]
MNAPQGVLYIGVLLAVTVGMSAWRLATSHGGTRTDADRALGACLVVAAALFVGVLLPYYVPGIHLP